MIRSLLMVAIGPLLALSASADLGVMMDGLQSGKLAAIVHDWPILQYLLPQNESDSFSVLNQSLQPQAYAFGLRSGSVLREPVNQSLLEMIQNPTSQLTLNEYLGN